ncbi:MAG: RNA polymerase-binding protein DksA [Deltaproteobacteria bacterium]|nr:MAG: RNA polymerase-binding protein DksA [Deltaproteobacteria bacterium]
MRKEQLEYIRGVLESQLRELLDEAEKTINDMTGENGSFPDPTDRASLESDRSFTLRIRDRERKLIGKIQEALRRIDEGTYGICEMCGGKISPKRLMARPVTTMCYECKVDSEEEEVE